MKRGTTLYLPLNRQAKAPKINLSINFFESFFFKIMYSYVR